VKYLGSWLTHPINTFLVSEITRLICQPFCENVVVAFCTPVLSGGYGFGMSRQCWWLSFFNQLQSTRV
jgi:hypothetical protein